MLTTGATARRPRTSRSLKMFSSWMAASMEVYSQPWTPPRMTVVGPSAQLFRRNSGISVSTPGSWTIPCA